MTHDFVDAIPGQPPRLRFSASAAANIRTVFTDLGARLSDRRDGRRQRSMVQRFAPNVYLSDNDELFHRQWDERVCGEILLSLERVLRSWDGSPEVSFTDPSLLDDWFVALAQARWLHVSRDGDVLGRVAASKVTVAWIVFVQNQVVLASGMVLPTPNNPADDARQD